MYICLNIYTIANFILSVNFVVEQNSPLTIRVYRDIVYLYIQIYKYCINE